MFRHSVSRRHFLYTSGALAATGGLLTAGSERSAAAVTPAAPINLDFWVPPGGGLWCKTLDKVAQDFMRLHPNIRFGKTVCGTGSQDFTTVILARITAGNPPDAFVSWDTPISLGVRGALVPLDAMVSLSTHSQPKNWPAGVWSSCVYNGKIYGLPATAGSYAFWYNQEWFEKKGIPNTRDTFPKTWDDLRKLSKEFTYWKGGQLVTAGYVPMRTKDGDFPPTIYIWSALNGGKIYDEVNHKYTIDSDQNVAMMEYMVSWLNEEYKGDMVTVERSGNWGFGSDSQNRPGGFVSGRMAMAVDGSWYLAGIFTAGLKFQKWDVASFPVGPSGTKTTSGFWPDWLVIPRGGHHVQEAFEWLDYLGSVGMRTWFANVPDLPANKTVPSDLVPLVLAQKRGKDKAVDIVRFFRHQVDIATPMWNSPADSFATDQMMKAVSRIMYKQAKPKDALAEAQRACQSQLQRVLLTAH